MRIFALISVCAVVGCSGGEKTSDSDRDDAVEDVDRDPNTDDTSTTDADGFGTRIKHDLDHPA
jgi:hypothetical protein